MIGKENQALLIANRLMRTDDEISLFEAAINNIFEEKQIEIVPLLLEGFDDQTAEEEVMFSLIHAIEYFVSQDGMKEYIKIVFENFHVLFPHAKRWAEIILLRLINTEESFNQIQEFIHYIKAGDKLEIKEIIKKLINRNPDKFKEKGERLLSLIR